MTEIKGWKKFQHFKDRRPPWIKLYRDLLDDPDWHALDGADAKSLVMLWLIASEDDGNIPCARKIAFRLRITETKAEQLLTRLSHWLIQDDITPISGRYQDDTPETEGETDRKEGEKKEAVAGATRPKASRLPDDWEPSDNDLTFAEAKGLTVYEIDTERIKFRNYWTAKSGKDATKLNWARTWQNWILNRRGTPNGQTKPNLVDAAKRLANTFADRPGSGLETGGNLVRLLPPGGRGGP
jgi:hypothetical protein